MFSPTVLDNKAHMGSTMSRPMLLKLLLPIVFTSLLGTIGCSSRPTMQELEKEAMATGDWSKVEKREAMDRKMGRVDSRLQCPTGEALVCSQKGKREECVCVNSNDIRAR